MLSATAIVLLDGPRVVSPAIFSSLVVMKSPVATVSKMPIDFRSSSMIHSRCGVYCVL